MAKKNPLKGALIATIIAAITVSFSYFVLSKKHDEDEKNKDKSSLLFSEYERKKIVEVKFENSNGPFELKRKAESNEDWIVSSTKSFEGDKGSIDGLITTFLASKNE